MHLWGCPIVDEDLLAEKYHVCFQLFMASPNLHLRLYPLFIATPARGKGYSNHHTAQATQGAELK
jgi:hypothetical protein